MGIMCNQKTRWRLGPEMERVDVITRVKSYLPIGGQVHDRNPDITDEI
jgi:hypothetical protein